MFIFNKNSFDIILNKKKKSFDENNDKNIKSKDDNNRMVNLIGINDYFKFKHEDDINPDVKNIEITQEDDSDEKNHKKVK